MLKRCSLPAPTAVRCSPPSPLMTASLLKGTLPDVGGGSVKNGERNTLARIPLRWMIRECFKANTGVTFDSHMLQHDVGLNVKSIEEAPEEQRTTESSHLTPGHGGIPGFSLLWIPVATVLLITSPLFWIWDKLPKILVHNP